MIEITLLTQDDCGFCDHAKRVLGNIAADHPIRVVEIDLASEEGRRLAERVVVPFAPGLLIDGKTFGYGRISERRLRRHLEAVVRER